MKRGFLLLLFLLVVVFLPYYLLRIIIESCGDSDQEMERSMQKTNNTSSSDTQNEYPFEENIDLFVCVQFSIEVYACIFIYLFKRLFSGAVGSRVEQCQF